MASNRLPQALAPLMTLAEDAADGAAIHETEVGLKQNTEAGIRADLAGLETAQTDYLAAKSAKRTLYTAQRSADSNGKALIGNASNVLGNFLGKNWSEAWSETGFPNQSTAIPSTLPERQALLSSLKTYFTNHPEHENAPLGVTAAAADTLFEALSDARSAVNNGLTDAGNKRKTRNAARKKLRKRLSGLVGELKQLRGGSDPVWLAFGLNMPDGDVTPEAPSDLVLTEGGPGEVLVDWDDVPNADHYRVFKQIVDVDAEFVAAGSPTDSDFLIAGVTNGQTLRVKVSAVSGTLEGPTSGVVEITLSGGGVTFRYHWVLTAEGDLVFWFEMPAGLSGVTNILLGEEGEEFSTAVSLEPGQSQQLTWSQPSIVGELDEVVLRDAQNNILASGVRDPSLPDPGP